MLALPGPGVLVIILGLVILATEFAWAERMLDRTTSDRGRRRGPGHRQQHGPSRAGGLGHRR